VATPLQTHYGLVKKVLLAGKHVLCEKPLCETVAQGRELIDLAQARGLVLMVGHVFLFNPGIMKVKQILETGGLGNLHYMHAIRTNLGPIRRDCNAAFDLATHDISIFNWLVGCEPLAVSATGGCFLQPGIEDVVSISLKYPGDVFGSIQASWLNPKKVRQITVVGSKQMVTWDDLQLGSPVACYDKGANSNKHYDDTANSPCIGLGVSCQGSCRGTAQARRAHFLGDWQGWSREVGRDWPSAWLACSGCSQITSGKRPRGAVEAVVR
jgi:predicted dehydrogenase